MNSRSFIAPRSTDRQLPSAISFAASAISSGMRRSRAKWLSVPKGRIPSRVSVPARLDAAALMVPSPPPTTSSSSPRRTISRHRSAHSLPAISSTWTSRPAARNASVVFHAISGVARTAPPSRFRSTLTRTMFRQRAYCRSLSLVTGTFADAMRVDVHLHRHSVPVAATSLCRHVHRVSGWCVSARHVRSLDRTFFSAVHLDIDFATAHLEVLIFARPVGTEEILLGFLHIGLRNAVAACLIARSRHALFHFLRILWRQPRDAHLGDRHLRLPQSWLDHRVAVHEARLVDGAGNLLCGRIFQFDLRSLVAPREQENGCNGVNDPVHERPPVSGRNIKRPLGIDQSRKRSVRRSQ